MNRKLEEIFFDAVFLEMEVTGILGIYYFSGWFDT